jgi:predicted TIM-barrel enzyme
MTCGKNKKKAAEGAVVTYKNILSYSKWQDAGIIIATGLHKPGEIEGRAELEKARQLGAEI